MAKIKFSNASNEDDLKWKTTLKYYKFNISAERERERERGLFKMI